VRVWDPFLRLCHWSLVLAVAAAWLTRHGAGFWHEWVGYAAGAVVVARLAWGFAGPASARFAAFLRSPGDTLRYAWLVLRRKEPRYVGHNPLGGWMSVALLAAAAFTAATGLLYTTERYWGEQWLEELHGASAEALLGLAAIHLFGVAYTSLRHGENLAAAMLHGRKRPEPPRAAE
jgi:cytochrome b